MKKPSISRAINREQITTFWWLISIAFRESRWRTIGYFFFASVQIATNLFTYYSTARVSAYLVEIVADKRPSSDIWPWIFLTGISSLIAYSSYRLLQIYQHLLYYKIARYSTRMFYEQLCSMDMSDFYDKDTRDELNRINEGYTWQLPNTATQCLGIVYGGLNTVVTVITIGIVAWWLIPVFAILLIPSLVYESKLSKINWFVTREDSDDRHIFWGLSSIFTVARKQFEIRALTAQAKLLRLVEKINGGFYDKQAKIFASLHWLAGVSVVLQIIREVGAQIWLAIQVINKALTLQQYFFYVAMVFRLDGALSGLFNSIARNQEGLKYSSDYRKFQKRKPLLVDVVNASKVTTSSPPFIEFVDAQFTYPGASKPVFSGLNLRIESGQKVALVGENGVGKSTVIKLLMRFYALERGRLLINGVDILDIKIESWYQQIATLFQDFNQYPLTVADNISISGVEHDDKRVKSSAKLSGADRYIDTLPKKYETYLDPSFKDGVEPSGGLWQRIALARAFYRDANIIILDEPTSAIDAKAEYEIFNNIFARHDGKTALIVSHRFSTVRKADRVLVLEGGKIVEDGTHESLLKKKGLYAEMFNKQAEGYR